MSRVLLELSFSDWTCQVIYDRTRPKVRSLLLKLPCAITMWSDAGTVPAQRSVLLHCQGPVASRSCSNSVRQWPYSVDSASSLSLSLYHTIHQQEILAEKGELPVELISLPNTHASLFPHYSSTRISCWENWNCLLRVCTTKIIILCAISSPFSPPLQMC
jgi:hypothetical protein